MSEYTDILNQISNKDSHKKYSDELVSKALSLAEALDSFTLPTMAQLRRAKRRSTYLRKYRQRGTRK